MIVQLSNEDLKLAVEGLIFARFGGAFLVENVEFVRAPAKAGGVRAEVTIQPAGS